MTQMKLISTACFRRTDIVLIWYIQ